MAQKALPCNHRRLQGSLWRSSASASGHVSLPTFITNAIDVSRCPLQASTACRHSFSWVQSQKNGSASPDLLTFAHFMCYSISTLLPCTWSIISPVCKTVSCIRRQNMLHLRLIKPLHVQARGLSAMLGEVGQCHQVLAGLRWCTKGKPRAV